MALLSFVASSGFTTILHNCTMEVPTCCEVPTQNRHEQCDVSVPPEVSIRSDLICHTNTVVGGLKPTAAVLEKESKSESKKLDAPLVLTVSNFSSTDQVNSSTSRFFSFADIVFFPSVEKYVLNASFLI